MSLPTATVENLQQAQHLIKQTQISCRTMAGGCAPNVAMLLSITPKKRGFEVGACTSFLIENNLLLTNAHCIPDDLRTQGASCNQRIRFVFPQSRGRRQETVECSEIVATAQLPDNSMVTAPDYAIVRLAHSINRPALSLNREGLPSDFPVSIIRISPHFGSHTVQGDMSVSRCRTAYKTFYIPQLKNSDAPVMTLSGCLAVHGNSGSPVFDSSGSVRALLYMGLDLDPAARSRLSDILPRGDLEQITGVTSLACIAAPVNAFNHSVPPGCNVDLSRAATEANRRAFVTVEDQRSLAQEVQSHFQHWIQNNGTSDILRWNLALQSPRPGALLYTPIPSCLLHSPLSDALNRSQEIQLPRWAGRFMLNERMQLARTMAASSSTPHFLQVMAPSGTAGHVQIRQIQSRFYSGSGHPRYQWGSTWFDNSVENCPSDVVAASNAMGLEMGFQSGDAPMEDDLNLEEHDIVLTHF